MNFVADEGIDRLLVSDLRQRRHDVRYIAEMERGISDEAVLEIAVGENRVLLTADKDFGELVFRHGHRTQGIILLRLTGLSSERRLEIFNWTIDRHYAELVGSFTVVTSGTVRIRRLSQNDAEA